jgi:glycerate 2-kinase
VPEAPRFKDHADHIRTILRAAIDAADPARCVREAVRAQPLGDEPVSIVAIGKAAGAMFEGFREATGRHHDAVMAVPDGVPAQPWAMRGDHPLPTVRSLEAGEAVRDFVQRQARAAGIAGHGGIVFLISGGASALVTLPVASIPLDRYRALTDALLRSGEPIAAINTVRKHCEQIKGGRLALLARPAWVRAFILSDVIGDDPSDIASGPVSPDPTTFAEAHQIVARIAPGAKEVLAHLDAGRRGVEEETPKPGDPVFQHVRTTIVGSNRTALAAAREAARALGFTIAGVRDGVIGEASAAGRSLAAAAMALRGRGPAAILEGGETTVTVGPGGGLGGRCQELALAAALSLSEHPAVAIGAAATDGADGPAGPDGPAPAGAIVTGRTANRAGIAGVDPGAALANHDSRRALEAAGALIHIGPTGTNVNDIAIALVYPE